MDSMARGLSNLRCQGEDFAEVRFSGGKNNGRLSFGTRAVRPSRKTSRAHRSTCTRHRGSLPGRRPRKAEALKQSRLLRGLLELVEPVEHGAATRPSKKLRLEEGEALQGGLSLH